MTVRALLLCAALTLIATQLQPTYAATAVAGGEDEAVQQEDPISIEEGEKLGTDKETEATNDTSTVKKLTQKIVQRATRSRCLDSLKERCIDAVADGDITPDQRAAVLTNFASLARAEDGESVVALQAMWDYIGQPVSPQNTVALVGVGCIAIGLGFIARLSMTTGSPPAVAALGGVIGVGGLVCSSHTPVGVALGLGGVLGSVLQAYGALRLTGRWNNNGIVEALEKHNQLNVLYIEVWLVVWNALAFAVCPAPHMLAPAAVASWLIVVSYSTYADGKESYVVTGEETMYEWAPIKRLFIYGGVLGATAVSVDCFFIFTQGIDATATYVDADYLTWLYVSGLVAFWVGLSLQRSGNPLSVHKYVALATVFMCSTHVLHRLMPLLFGLASVFMASGPKVRPTPPFFYRYGLALIHVALAFALRDIVFVFTAVYMAFPQIDGRNFDESFELAAVCSVVCSLCGFVIALRMAAPEFTIYGYTIGISTVAFVAIAWVGLATQDHATDYHTQIPVTKRVGYTIAAAAFYGLASAVNPYYEFLATTASSAYMLLAEYNMFQHHNKREWSVVSFLVAEFALAIYYNFNWPSYVGAAVGFGFATVAYYPDTVGGSEGSVMVVVHFFLLIVFALCDLQLCVIVSAAAIVAYLVWVGTTVFKNLVLFPLFLSIFGLFVIYIGVLYQKYQHGLRVAVWGVVGLSVE